VSELAALTGETPALAHVRRNDAGRANRGKDGIGGPVRARWPLLVLTIGLARTRLSWEGPRGIEAEVLPETEELMNEWARGEIDDDELIEQGLERFGPGA
jgi:hypothetical protein